MDMIKCIPLDDLHTAHSQIRYPDRLQLKMDYSSTLPDINYMMWFGKDSAPVREGLSITTPATIKYPNLSYRMNHRKRRPSQIKYVNTVEVKYLQQTKRKVCQGIDENLINKLPQKPLNQSDSRHRLSVFVRHRKSD